MMICRTGIIFLILGCLECSLALQQKVLSNPHTIHQNQSYSITNKQLDIHPSVKRVDIPRPNSFNPNAYSQGKSYRRQEVIHALNDLNDDSKKPEDDDIESFGKSIDSTGAEVKENIPKEKPEATNEKETTGTTKDIIEKIKQIQDKLFKRTGSKELEAKLKQMAQSFPSPKQPVTDVKTIMNTSSDSSKQTDGSRKPDRRKIIPEEVVDKILEKFQQLRQEAKHMALIETKHDTGKETGETRSNSDGITPSNPYASIGPAKQNAALKNKTEQNPDLTTVGINPKVDVASQSPTDLTVPEQKNIEIPIGNSLDAVQGNPNNKIASNSPSPMPVMFIKNGQMLVPVFGGSANAPSPQQPMSITGTGMAQISGNPGVALPVMPNNVVSMNNPQQLAAAFMSTMSNFLGRNNNALPGGNQIQFQNMLQSMFNQQYTPARAEIEPPSSRCSIPGVMCPTPTQHFAPSENPTENIQTVDNNPGTSELIKNILNAPGFPQLASRLMSERGMYQENPPFSDSQSPQTGDSRGFGTRPPIQNPASEDVQGMNPGAVQFGLSSPMFQNVREQEEQAGVYPQPTNPRGGLPGNPFNEVDRNDNMEEMQRENQLFNPRNIATNDISDPSQQADQLLNYARDNGNNNERFNPSEGGMMQQPYNNEQQLPPMLPTRMSVQRDSTERSLFAGVDPGSLLDKLHGAQLKVGLLGAGDPTSIDRPTRPASMMMESPKDDFGGSPDDLLEMLRNQNDRSFNKNFQMSSEDRMRRLERSRKLPEGVDPSFADDVQENPFGQSFDVQNKEVATENSGGQGQFVARNRLPSRHGELSVLPDNFVQYKHGRMSMDSANVVNSFFRDPQYYRNTIAQPPGAQKVNKKSKTTTEKPIVRASIAKALPDDNVELRVNGKKLTDKNTLRSRIINGKVVQAKGETFESKGPIQIELSHGQNKRKIVNIVTKSKYNVTESRKREQIPKVDLTKLVSD